MRTIDITATPAEWGKGDDAAVITFDSGASITGPVGIEDGCDALVRAGGWTFYLTLGGERYDQPGMTVAVTRNVPTPAEPQGIGAVVETGSDGLYIRVEADGYWPWYCQCDGEGAEWGDIAEDVIAVRSAGYIPPPA